VADEVMTEINDFIDYLAHRYDKTVEWYFMEKDGEGELIDLYPLQGEVTFYPGDEGVAMACQTIDNCNWTYRRDQMIHVTSDFTFYELARHCWLTSRYGFNISWNCESEKVTKLFFL